MADLEAEVKRDFMVKRSLMKGLLKSDNYKSRWFILTMNYLRYCDGTLQDGVGKSKGDIPLHNVTVIEAVSPDALNRPSMFQVVYHQPGNEEELRTLYIQASNEEQKNNWILALKRACQDLDVCMDSRYHPGAWRNGKFSCCDSISKFATGCTGVLEILPSGNGLATEIASLSTNSQPQPMLSSRLMTDRPLPRHNNAPATPTPQTAPVIAPRQKQSANSPSNAPSNSNAPVPKPRNVQPKKKMVLALYDFVGVQASDLSLTKGEEYELIADEKNWLKVKNKKGEEGFVPSNYVYVPTENDSNTTQQLMQYEWYYADTPLASAEEILKQEGSEGCFLVRDSRKPGMYSLSLFTNAVSSRQSKACPSGGGTVKHYHIKRTTNGLFFISENHAFATLPELIVHHKQELHGIATKLKSPPGGNIRQSAQVSPAGLGHETKEILISELTIMEELGAGQFGKVMHGKYKGTIDVAIKMLKEGTMSEDAFISEAKTMTKLQHKNLVQLYGVCTQAKPIYIVTEFMKYGALLGFLRRNKHKILEETTRLLDMACQICSAMVFLESKSFIHRDLAARNCLVGENSVVKVADFGLARFVNDDEYTMSAGSKFPVRWSAPEVILQNKFSSKSDIWSYGILLWEIFSGGEMPYQTTPAQNLTDLVCRKNKRLSQPVKCPDVVFRIMSSCWFQEADDRPTFAQLYTSLESVSES